MAFFVFILGLVIGSFLNVLIDRIPRGEKITGRSHCESCNHVLLWPDLIPLLSCVYLRGKCRYCGSRLSIQYPMVELTTGVLFVLAYLVPLGANSNFQLLFPNQNLNPKLLIFNLFVISTLVVVFFTDLKYGIIQDKIIFPAILTSFIWLAVIHQPSFISHLLAGVGALVFFLFIFAITKGKGMGFGDVKFSFLLGLILGYPLTLISLYLSFIAGAVWGIFLLLGRKKKMKSAIPFGPFMAGGALICLLFGGFLTKLFNAFFHL